MLDEVFEQPDAVARLLATNRDRLPAVAGLLQNATHVVIAARGTSDNAARYAQYLWGAHNQLAVGLTTPSLFSSLSAPPSLMGALVVGISQSGQSPDLVAVLAEARHQRRPTLAITNDPHSPLAQQADCIIELCAGPELAVAATKTYTAQLAAVALCSIAFAQAPISMLERLPRLLQDTLASPPSDHQTVAPLVDSDRCVVVGRGFQLANVFEWALKLQELTYILAHPFSAADFLHGPIAVVEPEVPFLCVATSGPTYPEVATLIERAIKRGAPVITITNVPDAKGTRLMVPMVEPWLAPIVAAPALQRFTHAAALARGQDPDRPRGLAKITRTT